MLKDEVVEIIAKAIAKHSSFWLNHFSGEAGCGGCDWTAEGLPDTYLAEHSAHVASVIAALPNIRIVDLVAERAEAASRDARRHLSEMRCINGVAGYYCNVTYAERDQYCCEYAAKGLTHYFDTPEHIAELEARAAGGQA